MLKPGALVALLVITAGCSGTGTKAPAPDASTNMAAVDSEAKAAESGDAANFEIEAEDVVDQEFVCRREKTIGSNIGKRVCRPRGSDSPTRDADQAELKRLQDLTDDTRKVSGN